MSVIHLVDHLDAILRHGLKERYRLFESNTEPASYWPFVAKKTFPHNVDYLQSLAGSRAGLDRGRAWLVLALSESALQTYFQQFAEDRRLTRHVPPSLQRRPRTHAFRSSSSKLTQGTAHAHAQPEAEDRGVDASEHYTTHALMMDSSRLHIVGTLLGELNDLAFQLPVEQAGTPLRAAAPSARTLAPTAGAGLERPATVSAAATSSLPPLVPTPAANAESHLVKKKAKRKVVTIEETGAPAALPSRPATAPNRMVAASASRATTVRGGPVCVCPHSTISACCPDP